LERLYTAYLEGDLSYGAISDEYAAGLATLPADDLAGARAIKGHVTGPVSWGLVVTDQTRRPILYEEVLADAVARHLRLKATWQEQLLRRINPNTIIFVDEPYMSSFGSAYVALDREQVITLMEEVLDGIQGLKGVHCCGNTDWSILLSTSLDILSLDAYGYAENLALYPDEVRAFLDRGGIIAWGIVPNSPEVKDETVDSLVERLHVGMNLLVSKGIPLDDLLQAALITPACGLGPRTLEEAERGLELMVGVSAAMRARYAT
jgi:methionine synthase II (cobalamin-independent)